MEKFTKYKKTENTQIQKEKDSIVYDGYIKVIKKDSWEFVDDKDSIVCLIYLRDEGFLIMRSEVVPPWQYKTKNLTSRYLTLVSGTIEEGESVENCLRRELYEEAGIVLNSFQQFEIEGPFFNSKASTSGFYTCLLELTYTDYKLVAATGDGSKEEKLSKTIKVNLSDIDDIKINDMITQYLITKLKKENNL